MRDRFIVAEVSKSWKDFNDTTDVVSRQLEAVINTNFKRGYSLKDWKLHTHLDKNGVYVETIIAIFESFPTR